MKTLIKITVWLLAEAAIVVTGWKLTHSVIVTGAIFLFINAVAKIIDPKYL